jgi:hypothetical protein
MRNGRQHKQDGHGSFLSCSAIGALWRSAPGARYGQRIGVHAVSCAVHVSRKG